MPVTEAERHHLYETLKSSLGAEDGETFMNLMPPANWNDFAMKSDIADLRAELKGDMAELRADLKGDIADLRVEVKRDLVELQRTLGTWLFASQAAVIAAIGVIAAVALAILT